MNDIQKRFILFLGGCIVVRAGLVYLAKNIQLTELPYMGYPAIIIGIAFFAIWLFGLRKTGAEVMGGRIWWNNLRPIHGFLYLMFAYSAINMRADSWRYLFADVVIGLTSFLVFHYQADSFKMLLDRSAA